jgi:DNA repair exonuclease SbcCD nuclease subunit
MIVLDDAKNWQTNFLIMSDIHFTEFNEPTLENIQKFFKFHSDFKNRLNETDCTNWQPDYLILAGDLTHQNNPLGYLMIMNLFMSAEDIKESSYYLKVISKIKDDLQDGNWLNEKPIYMFFNLDDGKRKIFTQSGNHDLLRGATVAAYDLVSKLNEEKGDKFESKYLHKYLLKSTLDYQEDFDKIYGQRFKEYKEVINELNVLNKNEGGDYLLMDITDNSSKTNINILGFNSSWFCSFLFPEKSDEGNLFLNEKKVRDLLNTKLEEKEFVKPLNITIMHHPFYSLSYESYQTEDNLFDIICNKVDIVICGHTHSPTRRIRMEDKQCLIINNAINYKDDDHEENFPRMSLMRINAHEMEVSFKTFVYSGSNWDCDKDRNYGKFDYSK